MLVQDGGYVARKPNPKRETMMVAVNLRVPQSLAAELGDGVRVLAMLARYAGEDPPDSSKAIRRFMRLGLDVVFQRVGGRPQTESDWVALEQTLAAQQKH